MKPAISRPITEGEWTILQAVWDCQPCAAPDIQEHLASDKHWSYSTVRTMMDRMAAKGLLQTEKVRHITVYRPALTRAQAQRHELWQTLKRAFNGALTPMLQCLLDSGSLSANELAEMEKTIRNHRKNPK